MHIYILPLNQSTNIIPVSERVRKAVCSGINTEEKKSGPLSSGASSNVNKIPQSASPTDETRLSMMITKVFFPDPKNTMTYSAMPFPLFLLQNAQNENIFVINT